MAYDSVYPDNRATSTVAITVSRNPNAPKFTENSYEKTVDEKVALGASIMRISATDADKVCTLVLMWYPIFAGVKLGSRIFRVQKLLQIPLISDKFKRLATMQSYAG